jgi:hypothetical protein
MVAASAPGAMRATTPSISSSTAGLIMAAISHVFIIARVAEMLGEDEEWLFELSIDMFPENGCLHILGTGHDETTGFTD